MKTGTIAIVGRPNVGKSTLFNRIAGERLSIVEDIPGVTRDRIYSSADWTGNHFQIIDTGGIQLEDQPFQEEIRAQVQIAIEEADVILMVCNGKSGMSDDDRYIAGLLQRSRKPIVLAVNQIDDTTKMMNIYEFYNLGIGDPIAVSGVHGIGVGDVLERCVELLPEDNKNKRKEGIHIAVIGEPNVGKSSIVNAILREDRSIVSNIQGTTRDAIDTPFRCNGKPYVIVDTAGIRKRGRVYESVEKYSVLRAMSAIEKCDVALFLIDGEKGIREQDKHVAGYAYEADTIIPEVDRVYENSTRRVPTNILNEVIADSQITTPAPARNGKRFRIYYATQVAIQPPTFVLSCNEPKLMHFTYQRFIENTLRRAFDFEGTPIHIISRKKVSE